MKMQNVLCNTVVEVKTMVEGWASICPIYKLYRH